MYLKVLFIRNKVLHLSTRYSNLTRYTPILTTCIITIVLMLSFLLVRNTLPHSLTDSQHVFPLVISPLQALMISLHHNNSKHNIRTCPSPSEYHFTINDYMFIPHVPHLLQPLVFSSVTAVHNRDSSLLKIF